MKLSNVKNFIKDHALSLVAFGFGTASVIISARHYSAIARDNKHFYETGVKDGTECCEMIIKSLLTPDQYDQFESDYHKKFDEFVSNDEIDAI